MAFSLDSNVLIDLGNDEEASVRRGLQAALQRGEALHVSPQALYEVSYGALISARPIHQSEVLARVLVGTSVADFTAEDARAAALVRAGRRKLGRAMGPVDAMIAGQAVARGWTVVTADTEDFDDIPGLSLVNWRANGRLMDK